MEICVLSIGKICTKWISEGINQFETRLERYIKYSSIILPDIKNVKSLSKDEIKEIEGDKILDNIASSDFIVLLDEKGKENTSREFAEWIQKNMNAGRKRVLLIIGGPYGFSNKIYKRANQLLSLSKMTLTHEMAKLLLSEQLYRGMTILKGEPYHHD
ncbi:MAG: 23S rRNA (pseudouridine(1915)-N(3))-methyltransferase RlmH [Muribaculaceae bacterium]|nr:23S rRNA (pseudouridine(1915)-N(3))-methyltransferase RlmH [Muribaculaceae bacterium]